MSFTPGTPRKSDIAAGVLHSSVAHARIPFGFPVDVPGSIMYLVCNRRRQIWALKPNGSGGFQVIASRGPLWPDTPQLQSSMGDIGGDSSGAWYCEKPATSQPGGPPPALMSVSTPSGSALVPFGPVIHRLDAGLNLVNSYVIGIGLINSEGNLATSIGVWPNSPYLIPFGAIGGGNSIVFWTRRIAVFPDPGSLPTFVVGGLSSLSISSIISQATSVHTNGTTIAIFIGKKFSPYDGATVQLESTETEGLPVQGFQNILIDGDVRSCDGDSNNKYACSTGYMARWSGGNLSAYKTAIDATQADQMRPQFIGGSSTVCYTTENNNEIVIRDGGLNFVRRLKRADIEQIVGPSNVVLGQTISNFVFTGIGGR